MVIRHDIISHFLFKILLFQLRFRALNIVYCNCRNFLNLTERNIYNFLETKYFFSLVSIWPFFASINHIKNKISVSLVSSSGGKLLSMFVLKRIIFTTLLYVLPNTFCSRPNAIYKVKEKARGFPRLAGGSWPFGLAL